jgi:hypothetical protein
MPMIDAHSHGAAMANPIDLAKGLAAGLGMPEAQIVVYDRYIRDAGLRSRKGRGRGAAQVTARDAANLVTAVLGTGEVKYAAHAVRRYSETRPQRRASGKALYGALGISELAALPGEHSFVDALEALIASAAAGSLAAWLASEAESVRGRKVDVAPLINIAASTPGTAGEIRIAGLAPGVTTAVRYLLPSPWDERSRQPPPDAELDAWETMVRRHHRDMDLEQFRRISAKTILAVADVIAPEEEKAK